MENQSTKNISLKYTIENNETRETSLNYIAINYSSIFFVSSETIKGNQVKTINQKELNTTMKSARKCLSETQKQRIERSW